MAGKTLYDKLWDQHLVTQREDGTALIYIDRHLIHEVTSPQAFEGLRIAGRKPWRTAANIATPDHNVPTTTVERPVNRVILKAASLASAPELQKKTRAVSSPTSEASRSANASPGSDAYRLLT